MPSRWCLHNERSKLWTQGRSGWTTETQKVCAMALIWIFTYAVVDFWCICVLYFCTLYFILFLLLLCTLIMMYCIHVVTYSGLLLRENDSLNKRMAYLTSRHDTTTQKLRWAHCEVIQQHVTAIFIYTPCIVAWTSTHNVHLLYMSTEVSAVKCALHMYVVGVLMC